MIQLHRIAWVGLTFILLADCALLAQGTGRSIQPQPGMGTQGPPPQIGSRRFLIRDPLMDSQSSSRAVFTLQDSQEQVVAQQEEDEPNLLDVPRAPETDEEKQAIGPPLTVQSNAANLMQPTRQDSWCNVPACPQRLFGSNRNGWGLGGWIQSGYHPIENGLFNNHPDQVRLHQFWLFAEKAAQPNCGQWDWGFRLDAVYGVDAQDVQAFGNSPLNAADDWDNGFDQGIYGWALPQAFVELSNGPLSMKAGHFLSPIGYESVAAVDNFFYSHTFMRVRSQPITLSGVMGQADLSSQWSVFGIASTGWNTGFDQIGNAYHFFGGAIWRPTSNLTVVKSASIGDTGQFGNGFSNNVTVDLRASETVRLGLQADWFETDAFDDVGGAGYLIIKPNECIGLGSRLEYYRTDRFGGDRSTWSWTNGINIRPHSNLLVRPEYRLDWGPAAARSGVGSFGIDAIIMF